MYTSCLVHVSPIIPLAVWNQFFKTVQGVRRRRCSDLRKRHPNESKVDQIPSKVWVDIERITVSQSPRDRLKNRLQYHVDRRTPWCKEHSTLTIGYSRRPCHYTCTRELCCCCLESSPSEDVPGASATLRIP